MRVEAQVLKGHLDTLLLASLAGGRCRRTYELTPAGHQRLGRDRAAWRDFAAAVSAILEPAL